MISPQCLGRALLRSLLLLFPALSLLAAPVAFQIPAQPAPAALDLFIKQSGAQVVYLQADVKDTQTAAVAGSFEPKAALDLLLKNTGLNYTERKAGQFTIGRVKPGSIDGVVREEGSGKPVVGARVALADTDKFVLTDKRGRFSFEDVPAGSQALHITAEGMQNTRVTDVAVKAGQQHTLGPIAIPVKASGVLQLEDFVVSAKKNDGEVEFDPYEVTGIRQKPFADANMDLPRTINDAQPYVIFDSKAIERSGSANIGDFLKDQLTMNATGLTPAQDGENSLGNRSSVNLRGLGVNLTLVLVNGRRQPGAFINEVDQQPDLNGIPLSVIDRIEILPTSASGIYGGSAVGGVINVVLKKNYVGGELRLSYDNTWDTDAARRTASVSYGWTLEGGRTRFNVSGSWSDGTQLVFGDRAEIFRSRLNTALANSPSFLTGPQTPPLAATPNVKRNSPLATALLTFLDGTPLGSGITYIPAGTAPGTSAAALKAALLANAGKYNLDFPNTSQSPTGLLRPLGSLPTGRSFRMTASRQMWPNVEFFAEFSYSSNDSHTTTNPFTSSFVVPIGAPTNPFTTAITVRAPVQFLVPRPVSNIQRGLSAGVIAKLPRGWTGEFDYTRTASSYVSDSGLADFNAISADLGNGTLNVLVDTLLYPVDFGKYLAHGHFYSLTTLDSLSLRGSGPLWSLPWGEPNLTVGLEHSLTVLHPSTTEVHYPITITNSNNRLTEYFRREQVADSVYAELQAPLVKRDWLPFVHELELQLAARRENFTVDAGTPSRTTQLGTGVVSYNSPTTNAGLPFFAKTSYEPSVKTTLGLKYQPLPEVTMRASYATAFLPPTPNQLLRNPEPNPNLSNVTDPSRNNGIYSVQTIGGGNPDLKPQNSRSLNAGIIWQPRWPVLSGLRLNAEYYRINQFDAIGGLQPQNFVDQEARYPGRVVRDASGVITLVDVSLVNLFKYTSAGWDFSADYTRRTHYGAFTVHATETVVTHIRQQLTVDSPYVELVNYPADGGATKYKANAGLTWEWKKWTAGWSARYFGSYRQSGSPGDPYGSSTTSYLGQGSATIPSQTYHDLMAGYAFGRTARRDATWSALGSRAVNDLTIQVGVRNIFNKVPPFDAFYASNSYSSPYGDTRRLRTYWINVRKAF